MITTSEAGYRRRLGLRFTSVVVAAGFSMAACSNSPSAKSPASSSTVSSSTQPGSSANVSSGDVQATLQRIGVQSADAPGYFVHLYSQGDQVAGQVTLDLCGGTFPSESLRIGRYQVGVAQSSQSSLLFSTEAVAYGDARGPVQAFSELSSVAAHCPAGFVQGPVAGEPPLKTVFNPAPDRGWPNVAGVSRLAFDATVSDQQGHSQRAVGVYLRRGRFLLGLYFSDPAHVPVISGQSTTEGIVHVFAQRLTSVF